MSILSKHIKINISSDNFNKFVVNSIKKIKANIPSTNKNVIKLFKKVIIQPTTFNWKTITNTDVEECSEKT